AASEYHYIEVAQLRERVKSGYHRFDRTGPLHLRGREGRLDSRIALRDDGLDVMPRGSDRAGHDADAARRRRQRALPFEREDTFRGEPALERLKTEVRIARARRPQVVDHQLAAAVAGVELDVAVRQDLRAIPRRERDLCGLHREERAAQLPDVVPQREVDVTLRRDRGLHHFAFDPEILELVAGLDVRVKPRHDLADADDAARRARDTHPSACPL